MKKMLDIWRKNDKKILKTIADFSKKWLKIIP